jgi:protein-disulfide isomerase
MDVSEELNATHENEMENKRSTSAFARIVLGLTLSWSVFAGAMTVRGARSRVQNGDQRPKWVPNAPEFAAGGHSQERAKQLPTLVVFTDYRCAGCRTLTQRIDSLMNLKVRVRVVERQLPISAVNAEEAAEAIECSADVGHLQEMRRVFADDEVEIQDGHWGTLAIAAGIIDSAAFTKCVKSNIHRDLIAKDRIAAAKLGITRLPAILVGDTLYHFPLELDQMVNAIRHSAR